MSKTGVLALQGSFAKHLEMLESMGREVIAVRTLKELDMCSGLIIPGGESTTLSLLLKKHSLWDELIRFSETRPLFGTCAGLIILSKKISKEPVETLGLIDLVTARNAYGRQVDSFIDDVCLDFNGHKKVIEGVFIRAPKIESTGKGVTVLGRHGDHIVMVEQGNILAATFHPELTFNTAVHEYFVSKCR